MGALMQSLSCLHPDIENFIKIKRDKTKVTGSNISVMMTDEFMEAVKQGKDFILRFPTDKPVPEHINTSKLEYGKLFYDEISGMYLKRIDAEQMFQEFVQSNWEGAEPGLLFSSKLKNYSPDGVYPDYEFVTTNPCFSKEATVLTPDGIRTVEEINVGDTVWSETGWTKIVRKQSSGVKPVYRYETINGVFIGTDNHRIVSNGVKMEVRFAEFIDALKDCNGLYYNGNKELEEYENEITGVFSVGEEEVFDITVDNNSHTLWSGGLNVSNCGEQPLPAYDCCRLLALNMSSFVLNSFEQNAEFDFDAWYEACYMQMFIGNIIVDIEIAYIQRIIDKIDNGDGSEELKKFESDIWRKIQKKCADGRRCGCGIMGLGDTLAKLNLPYSGYGDSAKMIKDIFRMKMEAELDATTDIAILTKPFVGFDAEKEECGNDFFIMMKEEFPTQYERMLNFGRANVSWSTVAPTGSGSILGQTTGGIEPLFMPFYKRRKKCMNEHDRVDFVDVDGEKFTEYFVVHVPFMEFCEKHFDVKPDHWHNITEEELTEMFKKSPYYKSTAPELDVESRINVQSIVQHYTSSAISSTINLPAETSQEQIYEIYISAFKKKLKGVTIYRDGSRGGVLVSSDKNEGKSNFFEEVKAPKRPEELPADLHRIKYNGNDYCVIIGLFNERPYECFVCCIDDMPDIEYPVKGKTIKIESGKYNFESDDLSITDIQVCDPDQKIAGFLISDMMRHRIPLKRIIKTISKTDFLITSYWTKLSKIIASYIPDGDLTDECCPDCWELYHQKVKYRRENGCLICPNGHSKC